MRNLFRKLFGGSSESAQVGPDRGSEEMYSGLRHQALSTRRMEVGIPAPPPEAPVWGILMETGYSEATATLLALGDGTTSLYLSSGGGHRRLCPSRRIILGRCSVGTTPT